MYTSLRWLLCCCAGLTATAYAQHIRGLSVVSDQVVWMSGSRGTVLRTVNSGKTWDTLNPPGFKRKDFRDIHAWNSSEAVILSSGDSAVFLKTLDGGKTWKMVYVNNQKGVFFDALDFRKNKGMAISDPFPRTLGYDPKTRAPLIGNPFLVLTSNDRGNSWQVPEWFVFPADSTEALFAASGSVLRVFDVSENKTNGIFVTGGNQPYCRNITGTKLSAVPVQKGTGKGIYSFSADPAMLLVAVGGDYRQAEKRDSVAAISTDSGNSWLLSTSMPGGYRSCVIYIPANGYWVCTGTNGTDLSKDSGLNWVALKIPGYNVCAAGNKYLWFAGDKGKWQKVKLKKLKT